MLEIKKGTYTSSAGLKCEAICVTLGIYKVTVANLHEGLYHCSGDLGFTASEQANPEEIPPLDLKKYFGSSVANILINFKD
jgi:hypothetical protein